jgi:hypothetical protein
VSHLKRKSSNHRPPFFSFFFFTPTTCVCFSSSFYFLLPQVRDLLGGDPKAQLPLKEHPDKGVFVEGLTEEVVFDSDSINLVMARGEQYRTASL